MTDGSLLETGVCAPPIGCIEVSGELVLSRNEWLSYWGGISNA